MAGVIPAMLTPLATMPQGNDVDDTGELDDEDDREGTPGPNAHWG